MDAKVISEITLDVAGTANRYVTVRAKQEDNLSRWIHAKITAGGNKFVVGAESKTYINFKRYDGETKSYDGEIQDDGTLLLPLPFWALELPYMVTCDISIIEDGTRKLTTFNFFIDVEAAAVSDSDVQADEESSFLLNLISDTEKLANDFKGYFVTNDIDKAVDVVIANRTQYCFSAGITSCAITIPDNAEQGWAADLALKIGDSPVPFTFVNKSKYALKVVQYSAESNGFTANSNGIVHVYITIDGMIVQCTIEELG